MIEMTIGMPVYNGAATLHAALDSLLAQSFGDFRLIISDNGSTDDTQAISEAYAARDPRVTYIRQPRNLGPQMNFRFVLYEAHTPYFMWAAADDLWAPSFIARNLAALQSDSTLVMSQSRVLFTEKGLPSHMATGTYPLLDDALANAERFFENPSDNSRYYGIFRTHALQAVFPTRPFFALDWLVSAATLRHGKHNEVPDALMIRDSSDPATYERAVLSDHRFVLWRIFPLLFMTRWLVFHRSVPLSRKLLHRLYKLNLYMHFRFGSVKFRDLAQRYLETNSLVLALGLRRLPPAPPAPPEPPGTVRALARPPLSQPGGGFPAEPPQAARLSLVIIADSGVEDAVLALISAKKLAHAASVEVILARAVGDTIAASAFSSPPGVTFVEVEGSATAGCLLNAGLARATAPRVLLVRSAAWYEADLLAALEEGLEQAALVAPQVTYEDGSLAAAGGMACQEAGLLRLGCLGSAAAPEFRYARACDFASTGLAVRREAIPRGLPFDETLQGFDAALADFCLRERSRLGAPLYWPWARLGCPDDAWRQFSSNPRVGSHPWSEEASRLTAAHAGLLRDLAMFDAEGRPAHDRALPRRLLYVDAITPRPDENAGSIEVMSHIKVLTDFGFRITFIPESNFSYDGDYTEALRKQGVEVIHAPHLQSVREVLEKRGRFDVVVLCRAYIAERYTSLVRELAPDARIIFYTVDLHFLREQREAKMSGDAACIARAAQSRLTELASVRSSDATIVHSLAEQELLARDAPGALVLLQPLMRAIPPTLTAPGPEGRRDILFVGTYQHPPNADAAIFFAREVWPLIRPHLPEARFLIVGSAMTAEVAALEGNGVVVLGFVQELGPLLDAARISVAPLRFGAGLKGKVATTLQAGLPTIATSIAAEGVPLEDGRDILLADTAEEITAAVLRLYGDDELWRSLAAHGFAFARREFSFEANMGRIANLLTQLGVATLASERLLLEADLANGDPIFRPSAFWTQLSAEHATQLNDDRLLSFKRTLNNCYMQWLPGDFTDPRLKLPMEAFASTPSMVPIEIANSLEEDPQLVRDVIGYGAYTPFDNRDYQNFYAFYTGLVWYLMTLRAGDDAYKVIEEPALGRPIRIRHKQQAISQDLAQSLLEYGQIRALARYLPRDKRQTFLELGAGYGRLAYVMMRARDCRYIIVDIPPTILVAKWYLPRVLPGRRVFGYRPFTDFAEVREEIEAADLVFLSPNQLALLPDGFVDVSISISSLHEMSPAQSARYRELLSAKTSGAIYFKQWIKWRNPADDIEVGVADYQIGAPWRLALEAVDTSNGEFIELGWLREAGPEPENS